MQTRLRRIAPALIAIPVLGGALAACGTTTVDPKSGEDLIRTYVKRSPSVTLKSVSCPSGVKPKDGTAFNCKLVVRDSSGKDHPGTITVHITSGGKKVEILGAQDIHVS
jgi:Domain of unknown function (DUF4333)